MSFWFRRKQAGQTKYYSVSVPIQLLPALVGIIVVIVLSLIQLLR